MKHASPACAPHRTRLTLWRARLAAACLAAGVAAAATAQTGVPSEFQGAWVPAKAACGSPLRLLVGTDRLTFENGGDRQDLGGIEMAGPGYFAPDYRGIMAVLIAEFSGQQPVTVIFNTGEKKGMAMAEFAPVMPGKATPQLAAYNGRITSLRLAKRFPFDKLPLKKCSATASR